MNTDELGREFWGILLFETHIVNLYQLLNIEKHNKSLLDFIDWLVYPDNIPLDSQKKFITILQNRFRLAQYHERLTFSYQVIEFRGNLPSIRPLSSEEKKIQDVVVELLKLKYQNKHLQPASFFILYELLSYEHFSLLLRRYTEKSYIARNEAVDFLIYHKFRGCMTE